MGRLERGGAWRAEGQGGTPWGQFQGERVESVGKGIQVSKSQRRTECREDAWREGQGEVESKESLMGGGRPGYGAVESRSKGQT